jgi:hypothetical protein
MVPVLIRVKKTKFVELIREKSNGFRKEHSGHAHRQRSLPGHDDFVTVALRVAAGRLAAMQSRAPRAAMHFTPSAWA